ncbi:FkbM family methyltransferase [Pseudolabrys taiwanensis]|uniref:FkbM family methyltransferase n=1 Tax=Pseudolabrys taiwanensis TaxID=331696 RepID=A0A345ZWB1_9HYPH|nr:FkbM family methyltransferase [Pseudolabrys taiwanensis]
MTLLQSLSQFPGRSQLKQAVTALAPSLWVSWRLMNRPRSAERELSRLKNLVSRGDTAIDVGANLGLYTRTLAGLAARVHAFEPSPDMATMLRRTSARNVTIHEVALSDGEGNAALRIPRAGDHLTHGLASLEPGAVGGQDVVVTDVSRKRLDSMIDEPVNFVKVDVEGHELNVLRGATALIAHHRPVFLVEAEDRHRPGATHSIFSFFRERAYDGFYLQDHDVMDIAAFDPAIDQDEKVLLADGGRADGRHYINNFFFIPAERHGRQLLEAA